MNSKSLVGLAFCFALILGGLALAPVREVEALPARDLKFYPKGIKTKALYKEMKVLQRQLGVKCNFCHVMTPRKQFAKSTEHKTVALEMLRLTKSINDSQKKIFKGKKASPVTCWTCHRGEQKPATPDDDE